MSTLKYRFWSMVLSICLLAFFPIAGLQAATDYEKLRKKLVQTIEKDVRDTSIFIDKKSLDPRVMQALSKVPRHEFVSKKLRRFAYLNRPLPIGHGQTISQPYVVALMTDLLAIKHGDKVLEVGTGSGYQTAILAEMTDKVYSIEIIKELAKSASTILKQQNYNKVKTRYGDGYYGWKEHAPFDVIIVTAASSHVPPPLLEQLKPGGRIVIPVGSPFLVQQLVVVEKFSDGKIKTKQILPVRFVPLTGKHD
jgi:protein-L-isoaspartate(D-aspartate) O-methyltransferase